MIHCVRQLSDEERHDAIALSGGETTCSAVHACKKMNNLKKKGGWSGKCWVEYLQYA